ncbi:hypothetical protein AB0D91_05405 [Streptomyces canus]|uniref:hypothetical protein n=1 Tax=Streptomyces canus TaxID=58343 RepID=UPI0033F57A57
MTGPSRTPRGEHAPKPGITWDTALVRREECVPECTASIRGTCLAEAQSEPVCDTDAGECIYAAPMPSFEPRPNRETRRAIQRATRRTT